MLIQSQLRDIDVHLSDTAFSIDCKQNLAFDRELEDIEERIKIRLKKIKENHLNYICTISVTCVKCGVHSTLCWKIANISHSTELFGL